MHHYKFLRFLSFVLLIGGKIVRRNKHELAKYLCYLIIFLDCYFIIIDVAVVSCCSSKSSSDNNRQSWKVPEEKEEVGFKIVSGDDAVPGEFPYQVCNVNTDFRNIFNNMLIRTIHIQQHYFEIPLLGVSANSG